MNSLKSSVAIIIVGALVLVCGCMGNNQHVDNTNSSVSQNPTQVAIRWATNHTMIDHGSVNVTGHSGTFSVFSNVNYYYHNYRLEFTSNGTPHHMDISVFDHNDGQWNNDNKWNVAYAMLDDHQDLLYNQDTHDMT